jgi:hypothetical protein
MELEKIPEKKKLWLPSRKINWILFGISTFIGIIGLILREVSRLHSPLYTLGEYLPSSFLLSFVLIVVIGFQKKISNSFLKTLFHAFLLNICMMPATSIILLYLHEGSISDAFFFLSISIPIFVIFQGSTLSASLIVISSWLLFLLLLGLSLWSVRKTKKKMIRIGGQILIILVFTGAYILCNNQIAKAVGAAIAATAFPPP